jgi:hypothetical protein
MLNPSGLEVRIGDKDDRLLTEYGLQIFCPMAPNQHNDNDGSQDEQEAALF